MKEGVEKDTLSPVIHKGMYPPQGEKGAYSYDELIFPFALARERDRGEGRTLSLLPAKMIAHSCLFIQHSQMKL